ncbi:YjcQ family protein [Lysinibacillus fusiformis]
MDNNKSIIKILSVLNDTITDDTIPVQKLNVQALGMTEPEYGRLIKIMLEAGLIKGFHPIRKMGQTYYDYKIVNPSLTLMGIEYFNSNK